MPIAPNVISMDFVHAKFAVRIEDKAATQHDPFTIKIDSEFLGQTSARICQEREGQIFDRGRGIVPDFIELLKLAKKLSQLFQFRLFPSLSAAAQETGADQLPGEVPVPGVEVLPDSRPSSDPRQVE